MVKDTRNLIVFPQYVVWVAPEDMDALNDGVPENLPKPPEEIVREGPQTRLRKRLELAARLKSFQASKGGGGAAQPQQNPEPAVNIPTTSCTITEDIVGTPTPSNLSSAGSVGTIKLPPNSSTRIADFAILQLLEGKHPIEDPASPTDVSADSIKVKIIVEIKRFATRSLEGDDLKIQVNGIIEIAINDALIQAALLFEKFEKLNSVIVIAASGDYWRHATIRRRNIHPKSLERLSIDAEYQKRKYVSADWSLAYALSEPASMKRLRRVFNEIRA